VSLAFLAAGRALRSFSQAYLGVVVPLYLIGRGADAALVGIFVTIWAAGAMVLGLLGGFLADRAGRRFVLFLFGALSTVCALAFVYNAPLWMLAAAGALGTIGRGGGPASGGAFGPYFSAEQALLAEHSSAQQRTRVFANFSFAGSVAGAGGYALASALAHPFFWVAVLAGAAMTLSIIPVRESAHHAAAQPRGPSVPLARETKAFLARLMITNAANGLAVGFLGPMLVLWFHLRYRASAQEIAAMYLIIALGATAAYLIVPRVVSAIGGAVKTVVSLRLASCALLAAMPLMPSLWLAGALFLVRMIFNSITLPVRQSYVMGVVPPAERSRAAAISNVPSQGLSMVGPAAAGVIIRDTWLGLMLEIAAALQLLNAGLYWRFFRGIVPPEELIAEVTSPAQSPTPADPSETNNP
jgi:MFS family permease